MTRPLFTGSQAERAELCPASQALPWAKAEAEPARRGNVVHAFLALVPRVGREAALAAIATDEDRATCAVIDLDRLPIVDAAGFAAEVALAYDVELTTAREIGRDIGRAYGPLGPHEVPLTLDVLGLGADGQSVFVGDYKTGRGHVTPARENRQLRLGALAACRAYGRERAEVALVHVVDDHVFFDRATLDIFDLDAHADDLRITAAAVLAARQEVATGRTPDVVEGAHCRYCPAFKGCPAKTSLLRNITERPSEWRGQVSAALVESEDEALDLERARQAYMLWRRAKEVVDRAGDQLHAYAFEVGGIPLDDGRVFGPVRTAREYVDGAITRKVLTELHGADIAERAVTYESTKSAIRDALRVVASTSGAKITHLERDALAAIDAAGGLDRRETATVKEHYPKAKKEIAS